MAKSNMSVARVERLTAKNVGKAERHNERKNQSYGNINVVPERMAYNVSFKSPAGRTYKEYFEQLAADGIISTRGLKSDATLFNEVVIDVNTEYFEERGGYEYARRFYEEAYRFCCKIYGEQQIVSAVMHADEINKAVSEQLGKPVYHYHLHVVAIPTVEKEIRWSKRCKDEKLRGTVREVIRQVSHSKKWKNVAQLDDNGKPVIGADGKPRYIKSYSILQDQLFEHMSEAGFTGFQRGERGSTAEHLSNLEYQIQQEKERLAQSEERADLSEARLNEIEQKAEKAEADLQKVKIDYEKSRRVYMTYAELDRLGKKGLTGKYVLEPKDYKSLVAMAQEAIASRGRISQLNNKIAALERRNDSLSNHAGFLERKLQEANEKYDRLAEDTRAYLEAVQRFPERVRDFLKELLPRRMPNHEQEVKQVRQMKRDNGAR